MMTANYKVKSRGNKTNAYERLVEIIELKRSIAKEYGTGGYAALGAMILHSETFHITDISLNKSNMCYEVIVARDERDKWNNYNLKCNWNDISDFGYVSGMNIITYGNGNGYSNYYTNIDTIFIPSQYLSMTDEELKEVLRRDYKKEAEDIIKKDIAPLLEKLKKASEMLKKLEDN